MSNRLSGLIKNDSVDSHHGKRLRYIMVGCFILGNGVTFNFEIGKYVDFTELKKAIWEDDKDYFASIGVNNDKKIKLWKVEIPTRNNDKYERLLENHRVDLDVKEEFSGERLDETWHIDLTFKEPPPKEHIHIIVQPPSSPATTGKRPLENSDEDQNSKRVKLADPNIISTARRIMEDIMKLDENETIYSDPKNFLSLPYPYLGEKLPIDRFDIDHDGSFIFMGRTKFEQVLEDINKLRPRSYMKLFIYGTVGYGKSHILTAIACFLFRTRRRVVFLPDCRQLAVDPVEYIKLALFLTYENDDVKISEINACEDFCQIIKFCKSLEEKLYFIVDQMNALDEGDNTGISLEKKRQIRENLDKMVDNHFYIMSSSANNKTMLYLMAKQTGELKIKLFGGFDEGEMKEWWNKHNSDWIGSCMEDAKIFKKILQRVKEKIPPKDTARLNELNKFGTGEDELNQKILQAINDICSLTEVNALKIDTINWYEDATANIHTLKREVNKCKKNTIYETMWTRIEYELDSINVEELTFDHPLCSGILDITLEPFQTMPESLRDAFKDPFNKYLLPRNEDIFSTCKQFIENEQKKINIEYIFDDINFDFGVWLDKPDKLKKITKRLLKVLCNIWSLPKYESFSSKGNTQINEGSYVCEVISPLLSIIMKELPGNPSIVEVWGEEASKASAHRKGSLKIAKRVDYMITAHLGNAKLEVVYLETGRPISLKSKQLHDHKKLACIAKDSIDTVTTKSALKRVFNKKKKFLTIFNINIKGDVMEIWCMRKEDGIYKYCLLDKAPIPLQITPANVIYSFIHLLLTLRTAVACTLFKINNDNSVKEYESDESEDTNTSITITTPQHHN